MGNDSPTPAIPSDPNTVLDVPTVAALLQTSRDTVYDLVRSGKLKAKRLGLQRCIRIPVWSLLEFINTPDN
jgi:excisionase family DNA binding protein